jgi:hypothetical protein
MNDDATRVKATAWVRLSSILLIGWNLIVVLASSIGLELMRQAAAVSFSNVVRGGALVLGALGGVALGIWIAWAMRDFFSRQPLGRALAILVVLLALTYIVFPRSLAYVQYQGLPSTYRP